jgi:hypothetical protein
MGLVATLSNLKQGLAALPWPVPRRLRALANDHESIAFVESEFIANLFGNDDLSFG